MKIISNWYNLIDINKGFSLQTEIISEKNSDMINILGCEHNEVISLGKSIWKNYEELISVGNFKSIHKTERGGKITLHNPGQLIIYPVFNLKKLKINLKEYVCLLLRTSSECLNSFGINSNCNSTDNIGVYVDNKKIVSIGLKYQSGWVSHGLSININNNLDKFHLFDICGQKNAEVTSFLDQNINSEPEIVFKNWVNIFEKNLSLK